MEFRFLLNGKAVTVNAAPEQMLINVLRNFFHIASVRRGCEGGLCGICSVLVDGVPIQSCLVPMFRTPGADIITEEGLREKEEYKDLLAAFAEADYHPCDYCRPSTMLIAYSILERSLEPKEAEILDAFSGKSCSCTDPEKIVKAIRSAGRIIKGHLRA